MRSAQGLRLVWVRLPFGLLILLASTQSSGASTLELRASLDEHVYVEGQRIEVVLCLANRGAESFKDVAPLSPANVNLELSLKRGPQGDAVPRALSAEPWILRRAGPTLRPGEVECKQFNLLTYFGFRPSDGSFPGRLGKAMLSPGKYRLSARLYARSGFVNVLKDTVIESSPVEFEIRPLGAFPAEANLIREFISGRTWRDRRVGSELSLREDYCKAWLPGFEKSRFFLVMYMSCGRRMREIPLEYLLQVLEGQGAAPERVAAAISIRSEIDPNVEVREPGWTDRLKRFKRGDLRDDVIDALRRSAAAGRIPDR